MCNVVAQLSVTMVLARLLTPEEYGIVAVLAVFTGFFSLLSDMGLSSAIIQFDDLTQDDYGHLFAISFLFGLVLSITFFLLSLCISVAYSNSLYVPLGALLMISVFFNSLNMVPNGLLLRKKRYDLVGFRLVSSTIIVGLLTIALACLGLGCYAIVLQSVLGSLFVFVWNWISSPVKFAKGSPLPTLKRVGKYSVFQFGTQAVGYFAGNLDSLLVGKFFGPSDLGHASRSSYSARSSAARAFTCSITPRRASAASAVLAASATWPSSSLIRTSCLARRTLNSSGPSSVAATSSSACCTCSSVYPCGCCCVSVACPHRCPPSWEPPS